jgi:predicted transposase/invertase (TIGR01784 family)
MQEYHAILQKKYQKPISQIVYYLGDAPSTMRTQLKPSEVFTSFKLISFKAFSYKEFIESERAEEVIMAVLADFEDQQKEAVVNKILSRLAQLINNPTALNKYIRQLLIFARLRPNVNTIIQKQLTNMAIIQYDIEKDHFYLQGLEKGERIGEQRGELRGEQRGELRGELKAQRRFALACLEKGFSIEDTANLTGLSIEEVRELSQNQ